MNREEMTTYVRGKESEWANKPVCVWGERYVIRLSFFQSCVVWSNI